MNKFTIAHSPDTDDVFMFWAIATGRLDTQDRSYELLAEDIEVLNREALKGTYEITAISFGAYPQICDGYAILDSGASIGNNYGPILVAGKGADLSSLSGAKIAIPGKMTTAYLALQLALPDFEAIEMNFKEVGPAVARGDVAAGLLIHEGQLTWQDLGLAKVLDLGEWWHARHQLPIPLGGNAIRRDLGPELMDLCAEDCRKSIELALEHRDEALRWTQERCPGLDFEEGHKYLDMYVNEETRSMSAATRKAIGLLFQEGVEAGIVSEGISVDIIG
ncbi:MAG: 1,4-dihydroxy-6-naphthoate synthase [Planctomycetota bacterium]|jgi:1,4-dihydroxy-6-naphthoate synthase